MSKVGSKTRVQGSKTLRGNAGQYFVAGELARRGIVAVITVGNCPNTDILCSDVHGKKSAHIQVKTFVPGNHTCTVGEKAETNYGPNFFWVLAGVPPRESDGAFEFFVIPSKDMAREISKAHQLWLNAPGRKGQKHNPTKIRTVHLPPRVSRSGWSIDKYRGRWDLIEKWLA